MSDHHHHGECCSHDKNCHENHHHECCHHHEHEDFAKQLLEMADEAWMEVLKEKIKEEIRSTSGSHLEGLAKIVSEANSLRWKNKLSSQKECSQFKEKIHEFFNH
jgi:hypothetical protein